MQRSDCAIVARARNAAIWPCARHLGDASNPQRLALIVRGARRWCGSLRLTTPLKRLLLALSGGGVLRFRTLLALDILLPAFHARHLCGHLVAEMAHPSAAQGAPAPPRRHLGVVVARPGFAAFASASGRSRCCGPAVANAVVCIDRRAAPGKLNNTCNRTRRAFEQDLRRYMIRCVRLAIAFVVRCMQKRG